MNYEDKKLVKVEVRLTISEKENLKEYCKNRNITVSEFIRSRITDGFQKEEK